MSIADLRKDYTLAGLRRADLNADPIQQFQKWFQQALDAQLLEPTAMTLATTDKTGRPSARVVLLKGLDGRGFIFYTNYQSRKGRELAENSKAALVFYWAELERQVRIGGSVGKMTRRESEAYFKTRPRGHKLGAWVSNQSEVIADRKALEKRLAELEARYPGDDVPLPSYWGGYILSPVDIEFWQGRPNRLHDRFRYTKQDGNWLIERLAP